MENSPPKKSPSLSGQTEISTLLHATEIFEPVSWAMSTRTPAADLMDRISVASAHRLGVIIYLTRTRDMLGPDSASHNSLEILVADIISHLSVVSQSSALFTATTWPTFIAGLETSDSTRQAWVANQLQELWNAEPWGLIRGALSLLERTWEERRNQEYANHSGFCFQRSWIVELKAKGVNWLVL